jgi:uncharacterized protein
MNDTLTSLSRRGFLTSAAFTGLALSGGDAFARASAPGYGPLQPDPAGMLDLPRGFSYRVISSLGDTMDDGHRVPDNADGMGAIRFDDRRVALVRNHELRVPQGNVGPFKGKVPANFPAFDTGADGQPLPGGTTTIIYDYRAHRVESQHLSLSGTIRNCAGGTTPWGSWLTCEEDVTNKGIDGVERDHGWVFEVPAAATRIVDPVPLTAMGRFNHEAAAVDPRTGIVYLTEDREDGLFYRFLPATRGELARGGRLQALAYRDTVRIADTRNWEGARHIGLRTWEPVRWVDLDHVESPDDDLRRRGYAKGGVIFARGEGVYFGDGELYFCCTSGGAAMVGQIMRYRPSRFEGQAGEASEPGALQLFVESPDRATLNFGDNIAVAPTGHLIVCEDEDTDVVHNRLRGVAPNGAAYDIARLHLQTETAGACFSPDGETMFLNIYSPAKTLAITGPWRAFTG